ncbi:serine hydrolase domain-containing protein [Exilibacterium tricleocarpae]|uniref:serine hydrolase domain-containing protein n=1 Tax=Exilibacterium tricleocarpae TaxID=2591008 RepID=UPI0015D25407|nr:serine hydrolase domain-containing protein [Exilibacterium tricleocarpae]
MKLKQYTILFLKIFSCLILLAEYCLASSKELAVEQAIQRITSNLIVQTSFEGEPQYKPLNERMKHYNTPGVSIAVVEDFKLEWARGFGVKEKGKSTPVTDTTLFQAGSISKPIFAVGVMKLFESGRFELDENINNILTSWKVPSNGSWSPVVTLRHLLSHSAGTTVHGFPGYTTSEAIPSLVDILNGSAPANTDRVEVNIIPGINTRYSGGGTTIAQLAVMDRLQMPFPEIMRKTVFEPLDLKNSTFQQPLSGNWKKRAATAHPWKGRKVEGKWHIYPEMAAAGLWTTPSDLALVGIEIQKTLRGNHKSLLSDKAVKEMLSPVVSQDIGIGFFLSGDKNSAKFGHDGWDEGFVARMTMFKETGQGFVVMINSNEGASIIKEIENAIAKEYDWPGYNIEPTAFNIPLEKLKSYAGTYKTESGLSATLTLQKEKLTLAIGEQNPLNLAAHSETSLSVVELNTTMKFLLEDKKVTGFHLSQGNSETKFLKQ